MQERLKELPKRLLELWNKYTSKQKTIIISVFSGLVLALAILIVLLSRTKYVTLSTLKTPMLPPVWYSCYRRTALSISFRTIT